MQSRDYPWFQRHAANRAGPRAVTNDLRMHGAGVFNSFWFQSHATGWTRSRTTLPHLGIHWTDVSNRSLLFALASQWRPRLRLCRGDSAKLHQFTGSRLEREIFFRFGIESLLTSRTAEVVDRAL